MKKIMLILFTLILFSSMAFAVLSQQKITPKNTEKELDEAMAGIPRWLCTGENYQYGPDPVEHVYYTGNPLTEEAGNCNAMVGIYYWIDQNLTIFPNFFFGLETPPEGLTFPMESRVGYYVESEFNWDKPQDYCFTETYTPRHVTGAIDGEPVFINGQDWSRIHAWFGGDVSGQINTYEYHIPVTNVNKPVLSVGTDKQNYLIGEGEVILPIQLSIQDNDLLCGNANWGVKMHVPLIFRNERSAETFEIRVDGEALPSNDVNSGSFGIFITEENTGELIINWDSTGYPNGEHQITITVFDTDGYRVSSEPGNLGPFFVEEYGTPIETTINVTIEGRNVCGDADASGAVDIDDVVYLINYIFAGGPEPNPYWTGDADGSGAIDIDDVVYLINYIFSGGPAPVC